MTDKFMMFSTRISDYDELEIRYAEWCNDWDMPLKEGGEFEFHARELEHYTDDLMLVLERLDDTGAYWLAVGHDQSWVGVHEGGAVYQSIKKLYTDLADKMDDVELEYDHGHFQFRGYHHDGTNVYDIYRLKSEADGLIADADWFLKGNRELNEKLMAFVDTVEAQGEFDVYSV